MKSLKLSWLLVAIFVLTVAGSAGAQAGNTAESARRDALRTALSEERYLDAYNAVFALVDSAPADLIAILHNEPASELDQRAQVFARLFANQPDIALADVDDLPEGVFSDVVQAAAHEILGNAESASESLSQALTSAAQPAQLYGLMAGAAFAGFNLPDLLQYSNQALKLDDSLAGASRLRGIGEMFSGDPGAAIEDADRAIELEPSAYFFHFLRANAHFAGGDPEAALRDVDAALALEPNSVIGYATRSRANMALGNLEQAAQDFLRSVEARTVETVTMDALVAGEPRSATMTFGTTFTLPFEGEAGQVVTISVNGLTPGSVDSVVVLLDPEGVPIAFNDDASDETLDAGIEGFMLSVSGVYTVIISHANGGSEGDITVTMSVE